MIYGERGSPAIGQESTFGPYTINDETATLAWASVAVGRPHPQ
jgi:hypothetical protein